MFGVVGVAVEEAGLEVVGATLPVVVTTGGRTDDDGRGGKSVKYKGIMREHSTLSIHYCILYRKLILDTLCCFL